jgi:hypothetical protein
LGIRGLLHHLQFEQVGEQYGFITSSAASAQTKCSAEEVVLCTTSFANLSLAADVALVHGVSYECAAPTEFSAQLTVVDGRELDAAESE